MMVPAALLAFGGRAQLQGEIDCVVDGGCTAQGCVSSAVGLNNLRDPEIPCLSAATSGALQQLLET